MAVCADWHASYAKEAPIPRAAVAVLICRGDRVLMCKRKVPASYDEFALPGGFLEFGETFEECACREVEEETGLQIQNIKFGATMNTIMLDDNLRPSHYVTIFMKAEPVDLEQEPETLEPEQCAEWNWILWPNVPEPVFKPIQELLDSKYDPFL